MRSYTRYRKYQDPSFSTTYADSSQSISAINHALNSQARVRRPCDTAQIQGVTNSDPLVFHDADVYHLAQLGSEWDWTHADLVEKNCASYRTGIGARARSG